MKSRHGTLLASLVGILCAAAIGVVQPKLDLHSRKIKLEADTASIPPPRELRAMSLGYFSAAADIAWASLLVQHGLHSQQRRGFVGVDRYIQGIIALDPQHPSVYQFLDTLLVLAKPGGDPTTEDIAMTRALFEQGLRDRPYDADIWLRYGQFLAFMAPSYFDDHATKDGLRREGAFKIARAIELGANVDRSIAASSILSSVGEKKASIKQLQTAYALTDNPETRRQIMLKLRLLETSPEAEEIVAQVEHDWRTNFPFLTRGASVLVGPSRSPATCAGPASYDNPKCASDWSSR